MIFQTASFDPGTRTDVLIHDVIGVGDNDNDDYDLLVIVTVLDILCVRQRLLFQPQKLEAVQWPLEDILLLTSRDRVQSCCPPRAT